MSVLVKVRGVVQGVGFRPTVARLARELGYSGYVLNRGSHVEIYLSGAGVDEARSFMERVAERLPPTAEIEALEYLKTEVSLSTKEFEIRRSMDDVRFSSIPPDTAVCDDCLRELFDPSSRRYMYPFTNCTVCGARFSITVDFPYDRERTSMSDYPMCSSCRKEYGDPHDRRYDAQTISCPACGPGLFYTGPPGVKVTGDDAVKRAAAVIDSGRIVVIKSWGGMHIAARADIVSRVRSWYNRPFKPFAVMVRDTDALRCIAVPNEDELRALLSPERPIVLVRKESRNGWVEELSPGLDTVGVFFPYTPIHHLLFHWMEADTLIMTSANMPGRPMITDNDDALSLGADGYLLHDRAIVNRVDDSLIRINCGARLYIRRSRGVVPRSVELPFRVEGEVLAVGAELNNVGAVTRNGRLYLTQYIGDCSVVENLNFLETALRHYLTMFRIGEGDMYTVACDMHPSYASRLLAREFSDELSTPVMEIQHHYAHAAALMLDNGLDEVVAVTLDGTGYGTDGAVWGGEVIHASGHQWVRVGHLSEFPVPGGDLAVRYPARTLCALAELTGRDLWEEYFPDTADDLRLSARRSPRTTSMGRFMDALSALLLGVREKTYEGEPAMRLEPLLDTDRILKVHGDVREGEVDLTVIMEWVLDNLDRSPTDVASTAVATALRGLYEVARGRCDDYDVGSLGLTGGVAYNRFVCSLLKKWSSTDGLELFMHRRIPPGDGGIAAGQIYAALLGHCCDQDAPSGI